MRSPRLPKLRRRRPPPAAEIPPPRRNPLAALGRGARTIAYAAQDLTFLAGRAVRGVGRGGRGFWFSLALRTRKRLILSLLGGAIAAAALAFAVPRLPCQFPGGDVCPPADDAAEIVPADALGYVHLTLDQDGEQYRNAVAILDGLPQISRQLLGPLLAQVPGPGGQSVDFERELDPWLGEQAALVILPVGGAAEQLLLFQEGDQEGAAAYASSLATDETTVEEYEGIEISTDSRGVATASVGGFLAVGTVEAVRRVIDVQAGAEDSRPLADDAVATELRDELPPDRFADAFVSQDGIESLIADEDGPLASAEPFVDAASSVGAAASLGAADDALELAIRSSLDPERAETNPGFFAAFPAFEPELPERLAAETLGYVGIADPGTTISELFAQATAEAPVLAEGLAAAVERLRNLGDVNVQRQLLPALGGEAAFALQPGSEQGAEAPPEQTTTAPVPIPEGLPDEGVPVPAAEAPVPILQFLAEGVEADRARRALARLQGPISRALDPGSSLQAPVFDRREFDGVELQVLRVSPTVNLAYALADDNLAVATQPEGVEQIIEGAGGLAGADPYGDATSGFPDEPSLLAYFNLAELVRLAEREGLAEDPVYALIAGEVRRLLAAGVAVEARPTSLATALRLVIEPAPEEADGQAGAQTDGDPAPGD